MADKMLQTTNDTDVVQNMETVLPSNEYKGLQQNKSREVNPKTNSNSEKPKKKIKTTNSYEDILYFVCNSCPYLCTKDEKITEHVETAHRNQTSPKLMHLKCPACPNVFYHKVSLRSHLIHDHGVSNSELSSILQAIVYFAKKNQNSKTNETQNVETKVVAVPSQRGVNCKDEVRSELQTQKDISNFLFLDGLN